jgi:hypothetical protein
MAKRSTRTQPNPQPLAVPNTKISATILDFGEPYLGQYDGQHLPIDVVREAMVVVLTVWNAHVMAMPEWGQPEPLAWLKDIIYSGTAPHQLMDLFEDLTFRRYQKFADDPRAVGDWDIVSNGDGTLKFRCDGRLPPGYVPSP